MEAACPRCKTRIDLPQSGVHQCPRCSRAFEFYVIDPAAAVRRSPFGGAAVVAHAGVPQEGARCATHANNPAAGNCERCGDFMCALCETLIEGRAYCPGCFDLLMDRGAMGFTQRSFTAPQTALRLGIYSILTSFCVGIGPLLAIAGVVVGTRALRQIAERPELPGKKQAAAGVAVSAVSLLLTLTFLLSQFGAAFFGR